MSGVPERLGFRGSIEQIGQVATLAGRFFRVLFTTRFEARAFVYQVEQLGVRSLAIASATAVFVGMVMSIQFGFFMEKYGAKEALGKVIAISEARELAPALTSLVVGSRIAAGMAAELGSMSVTEQIDAIRALGADPAKKLVLPRMLAAIIVMPILSVYALALGVGGAVIICAAQFDISPTFFINSSLESVRIMDFVAGVAKTPFFGYIIAIVGCHFGLRTTGGTEGVGLSTTRTVVAVSIAILIADFVLTKLLILFQSS